MIDHKSRQHSALGASKAHRWMACPASAALESMVRSSGVSETASPQALQGTESHEVAEKILTIKDYKVEQKSESELLAVKYANYIASLQPKNEVRYGVEDVVTLGRWIRGCTGTVDYWMYDRKSKELHVVDYKTGYIPVEVENNVQLMIYALGVLDALGYMIGLVDIDTVTLHIAQPRLESYRTWITTPSDLLRFAKNDLAPRAERCYDLLIMAQIGKTPSSSDCAKGDHCKYCTAKPICPLYKQLAVETFDNYKDVEVEKMDVKEIAKLLEVVDDIKSWCEEVKDFALKTMKKGTAIDGYKLVQGRGSRSFIADITTINTALQEEGIDVDILTLKTPAELERSIGKDTFSKVLGKYIKKSDGKPTIARTSDKRDALEPWEIQG
jgi:hypothetical protein